ncbi:MAG TPA: 2-dehydro-3-deoxygalactonokinase [Casimicrobiaceae bacterium]
MQDVALLAIDWGTTSTRAYAMDREGRIRSVRSAPLGVQRVVNGEFAQALRTLCGDATEGVPAIACGMIGSRQGWIEAPYCDCPADFDAVAAALTRAPDTELAIVPGLLCRDDDGIADVMRGEETQILGALSDSVAARQAVVLPGTHSKWAITGPAGIEAFATFMTGEMYALLAEHSILGRLRAAGSDDAAFSRGVGHSLRERAALTHDLFSARTLALTDALAPSGVGDYLSGLLLGAEIKAARQWLQSMRLEGKPLTLIGAPALVERYRMALAMAGLHADIAAEDAAARGLWRIARHAGLIG